MYNIQQCKQSINNNCKISAMFLTKKNATNNTKKQTNSKALGGWDDNEDDGHTGPTSSSATYAKMKDDNPNHNLIGTTFQSQSSAQNMNLLNDDNKIGSANSTWNYKGVNGSNFIQKPLAKQTKAQSQPHKCYTLAELHSKSNIQCETQVVEAVLEPGGIRVKPNNALLTQFGNEAKNLDISIIGSILISKLTDQQNGFQTKAKSLYAIEYLSKKIIQYSVYFKLHADKIKQSSQPYDNVENYNKIKKHVLSSLGAIVVKPQQRKQQQQIINSYVDPGYNAKDQSEGIKGFIAMNKKQSQKSDKGKGTKKLISPLDAKNKQKKVLAGPQNITLKSKKSNNQDFNLLDDDNSQTKQAETGIDLISLDEPKNKEDKDMTTYDLLGEINSEVPTNSNINFDQLIAREKNKNKSEFDFII